MHQVNKKLIYEKFKWFSEVSENQCNERNDVLCPLTIVFSVVLVFVGSALNFFYWKRQNSEWILLNLYESHTCSY